MKRISLALLITASLPAGAQAQRHFTITPRSIALALAQHDFIVAENQVQLVANVVADTAAPLLDVESAEPLPSSAADRSSRARVKLLCRKPSTCIPFYAVVSGPLGTAFPTLSLPAVHAAPPPISIHAGATATLIVESLQMRMSMPVISLQNGAIGARIRVTSEDRKQTYTATVISSTLLKGTL